MRLRPDRTTLIVIDVQEAFRKALDSFDEVAARTAVLVRGAAAIGVPIVVTEQYPKGLGATVPVVADSLPSGTQALEKVQFSAAGVEGFDLGERDQALVCGIEAHVCVAQTALDLIERGTEVHIAADAVGSRTDADRDTGLARLERGGAEVTTVEMALFELLGSADAPAFKEVQAIVK
jgi:nicotinamidase-related amidase